MHLFAAVDLDAPGLKMSIKSIALLPKIEDDRVSIRRIKRNVAGVTARRLFRLPVDDRNHESICHREHGLAEDSIALKLLPWAGIDAATRVHLLPVHSVALRYPHAAVDWQSRPRMAGGVAAGIRCNVTLSMQRRTDQRHGSLVNRSIATALAEFLVPRW